MAQILGGDIREVSYNHPTYGQGLFDPKSGEDSTYDLGGRRANDDTASVTAQGQPIYELTMVRWVFEVPIKWDMLNDNEIKVLSDMAGDLIDAEWTFTHVNGSVFRGTGRPVGDISGAGKASTIPLKVSGGGVLEKI